MVTHISSSPNQSTVSLASSGSGNQSAQSRIPPSQQYFVGVSTNGRRSSSISSSRTLVPPPSHAPTDSYAASSSYAPSSYAPSAAYEDHRQSRSRAPSVSSNATTTTRHARHSSRRHRSNSDARSRSREPSTEPEVAAQRNSFPWFGESGDVEIAISDQNRRVTKKYLLHRVILSQNSPWWEKELRQLPDETSPDEELAFLPGQATRERGRGWTEYGNGTANRSASRIRVEARKGAKWKYELNYSSLDGAQTLPVLTKLDPVDMSGHGPPPAIRNKPQVPNAAYLRDLAGNYSSSQNHKASASSSSLSTAEQDILTAYDNLFLVFYNYAPSLDPTNIATAYVQSKVLLQLGLVYQCTPVLGSRVEHHLLSFQSRLWRQIAKYPPSYLKLGHLAQSRPLFSEALIHVVGQWPAGNAQLGRGTIDNRVRDLIEDKVDELEELKARIEGKLFRLTLTTSRGERVTPANAWTDWLAVSLFRQWIVENTTPAPSGILKEPKSSLSSSTRGSSRHTEPKRALPPLGRIYRLLETGGQAYLSHDELKRFLKLSSEHCSRETLRRFERRMEELKNLASEAVRPLARSSLELDSVGHRRSSSDRQRAQVELSSEVAAGDLPYLTCAKIDEGDFAFIWA